jgi:hypothetical protein
VDVNRARRAIEAGTVLEVAEADFLYGEGRLRIRVDEPVQLHPSQEWATVIGTRVWSTGREVGKLRVLVRVAAIREALR